MPYCQSQSSSFTISSQLPDGVVVVAGGGGGAVVVVVLLVVVVLFVVVVVVGFNVVVVVVSGSNSKIRQDEKLNIGQQGEQGNNANAMQHQHLTCKKGTCSYHIYKK